MISWSRSSFFALLYRLTETSRFFRIYVLGKKTESLLHQIFIFPFSSKHLIFSYIHGICDQAKIFEMQMTSYKIALDCSNLYFGVAKIFLLTLKFTIPHFSPITSIITQNKEQVIYWNLLPMWWNEWIIITNNFLQIMNEKR